MKTIATKLCCSKLVIFVQYIVKCMVFFIYFCATFVLLIRYCNQQSDFKFQISD